MVIDKDMVGAFISGFCLIHCLAGPVMMLLGITSLGHAHVESESIHFVLMAPILFFAAWSIPKGLKFHHHKTPAIFAVMGLCILMAAFMFVEFGLILTVGGSVLLLSAHLYNRKLLRSN